MAIEWTTERTTASKRQISVCRRCKSAHAVQVTITTERLYRSDKCGEVSRKRTVTAIDGSAAPAGRVCCGSSWDYRPINGTVNLKVKCNAKCLESKGHVCECSCGGKNHGAGHEVEAPAAQAAAS